MICLRWCRLSKNTNAHIFATQSTKFDGEQRLVRLPNGRYIFLPCRKWRKRLAGERSANIISFCRDPIDDSLEKGKRGKIQFSADWNPTSFSTITLQMLLRKKGPPSLQRELCDVPSCLIVVNLVMQLTPAVISISLAKETHAACQDI